MGNFVTRILRLRPEEASTVLILGFILLANAVARQISGIVAVSGFLADGGVNQFLLVLGIDYAIILLSGGIQSLIVDRFDRIKLMSALTFGFGIVFVVLRLMFSFKVPGSMLYAVLYIVAEQQFVFFPLFFWVLANDIFDAAQARRIFPFIASFSFIGTLIGTLITYTSPTIFKSLGIPNEDVLVINALIYLITYIGIVFGLGKIKLRKTVQKPETVRDTLTEGYGFVKEVMSFRYLMLAIVALAVVDTIIEFRFYVITHGAFPSMDAYTRFFSAYRFGATLISFALQSLLTSRLIEKIGLKNSLLFFPIVAFAGTLSMIALPLALPGLITAIASQVFIKLTRETIDDSSRKSVQSLVPEERRGRVSLFMDSYLTSIGTIIGCILAGIAVITGLVLHVSIFFYAYLAVALIAAALAITFTVLMRRVYESSLLNWRLKRRQRGKSVLDSIEF
jgi:AAA family ATP:ADP antiporter